ncbi:demethoxyubiquinone hydroxylase family protein [Alkaliphilus peptidifermentans]|uniref:Ubiquinone biosynthesis protein COQ7 n=1 Tax=Alkaliphilus peptidifermentans DSM 18978 TaxID=1120976 RepID=A0A1G5CIA0_9FIRM|nr:demethoxyubiquinone hydroxylase family protein [Alkaliphilus peptidifermentans]SCY02048.1 Ubiquinone biosynthesis protein COQ7 [Alkaliphilus peptidifermentans DSM 18978]
MPSFANPFQGNINRKISKEELIQAVRLDIAGELEAIFVYDAHAMATDDPRAKKILEDIRDEEKAHVGELMELLKILDPREAKFFEEGVQEVREMMEELGNEGFLISEEKKSKALKTVGSLLEK